MAYEISNYAVKATFVAGEDLTDQQYKFVGIDPSIEGSKVIKPSMAGPVMIFPIGVLQNAPRIGEEAEVVLVGVTKLKTQAGASPTSVNAGSRVGNSGSGFANESVTLADTAYGTALTSATNGELATVAISTPGK